LSQSTRLTDGFLLTRLPCIQCRPSTD